MGNVTNRQPGQPAPQAAALLLWLTLVAPTGAEAADGVSDLRRQVLAAETAFAATMASRDHAAFATFIADDAVFFGPAEPLRGRTAVIDGWARFYEGPDAPFSWAPEAVEVLAGGTLAFSSGPVRNAAGEVVARFNSIWRREPDGAWRVVFDKGCDVCACAPE